MNPAPRYLSTGVIDSERDHGGFPIKLAVHSDSRRDKRTGHKENMYTCLVTGGDRFLLITSVLT